MTRQESGFWSFEGTLDGAPALCTATMTLSFRQLRNKCDALRNRLSLDRKSLFFIFSNNSPESIIAYLTGLRCGHTVFLIDDKLTKRQKAKFLSNYEPRYVWEPVGDFAVYNGYHRLMLEEGRLLKCQQPQKYVIHDDLALLLLTSGSTGSPKAVRLSYTNIESNARAIANYLAIKPDDRGCLSLPIHHAYGLSILNSHIFAGASVVCSNHPLTSKAFWENLATTKCTSLAGVPFTYKILKRFNLSKCLPSSLHTLTQAGGHLDIEIKRYFLRQTSRAGIQFFVMYGQTEATARMSYVPADHLPNKVDSIGIPIPEGELELATDGELIYRGPNVMMGYAQKADDLSLPDQLCGRLNTGDLGYRDDEGYFYLRGRKSRFVKLSGKRVNLDDLQAALSSTLGTPVYCIGSDDRIGLAITEGTTADRAKIQSIVAEEFSIHPRFVTIGFLDSIPRNTLGKVDRSTLMTEILEE